MGGGGRGEGGLYKVTMIQSHNEGVGFFFLKPKVLIIALTSSHCHAFPRPSGCPWTSPAEAWAPEAATKGAPAAAAAAAAAQVYRAHEITLNNTCLIYIHLHKFYNVRFIFIFGTVQTKKTGRFRFHIFPFGIRTERDLVK